MHTTLTGPIHLKQCLDTFVHIVYTNCIHTDIHTHTIIRTDRLTYTQRELSDAPQYKSHMNLRVSVILEFILREFKSPVDQAEVGFSSIKSAEGSYGLLLPTCAGLWSASRSQTWNLGQFEEGKNLAQKNWQATFSTITSVQETADLVHYHHQRLYFWTLFTFTFKYLHIPFRDDLESREWGAKTFVLDCTWLFILSWRKVQIRVLTKVPLWVLKEIVLKKLYYYLGSISQTGIKSSFGLHFKWRLSTERKI